MIETIFLVWLILCVVVFYVLLSVIHKRYENRLDTEVNYISDRYGENREAWIREIDALKEENDSFKVDNTVLQADNASLKEVKKHLDAELSCLAKEKTDVEIELIEAKEKAAELEDKLCSETAWRFNITPDTNDRVLICSVTKKGEKRINIAYYEDGVWHGNGNLDNVIAWRPLPELPEFEYPAEGGAE